MKTKAVHTGFHRIGDQPGHFIDQDRFLGRDPWDDTWMTKTDRPMTNVRKEAMAYVIEVALPGYSREDVTVSVEEDMLTIEVKKHTKASEQAVTYRQEFAASSFYQSFHIPAYINREAVEAKLAQGVLEIRLPVKAKSSTKVIPVG